jgi:hypothetical protein
MNSDKLKKMFTVASILTCVSLHSQADPFAYESFSQDPDASPENLIGTSGDTGLGSWRNGTIRNRNTGDLLSAGTSAFGTLSTAGNKFTPSFNDPSIAAPITAGEFSTLMADGNTVGGGTGLWMSALVTTRTSSNSDRLFIGIGDADVDARNIVRGNDSVEGGGAIGFFVNNGDDLQVLSWDASGTRRNTNIEQSIATSMAHLVVMQFITGTTGNSDTLNFFFPGTDLVQPTASLTQTLDIDQSGFDRLLISNLDGTKFDADEIRIGASYEDVVFSAAGGGDPFRATITPNEPNSRFQLSWNSQTGMLYTVRSSSDLGADLSSWTLVQGDIPASGTGTTTFDVNPPETTLFYRVEEYPPPPLLSEGFEGGALPDGWDNTGPGDGSATDWEVGNPTGGAPTGPPSAATDSFCAGTNIAANYTASVDVSLVSPAIGIPLGGAMLTFNRFIDTDGVGDFGSVRILDADAADAPIAEVVTGLGGISDGWTPVSIILDGATYGERNVKIDFRFVSNADANVWAGFYIDDVEVTAN